MLTVKHITKRFSGVTALDNVSMELQAGKVTALIGENGAGKSTLMKILSGVYQDFDGEIIFKGKKVTFENPRDARQKGISIIHQELNLIPWLTVRENIFLGRELTTPIGMLDTKRMRVKTKALLDKLRLNVDPETPVRRLKVGQQQVVEIAKALLEDAEVIIMDEPTSAISESEVEVLFEIIGDLRRENKAIVYISHKLDELFKIADNFIVLRDGKLIETGGMQGITHDQIISKMVGREINMIRRKDKARHQEIALSVQDLCLKDAARNELLLKNISFNLYRGEVLGIFGLLGAGRTELVESLFGLHARRLSGSIEILGKTFRCDGSPAAISAGMALVPEDRKKDGLVLGLDVRTNISLTTLADLQRAGLLAVKKERALAQKYISDLSIKTSSDRQLARNLSGGNQQKIVLAKWLATQPHILMLDEPTRGIDVNAKNEIYRLILSLAEAGLAIIVISSELPEILAISDRVLVMAEGNLTGEFERDDASEDNILKAAIPKTI